MSQDQSLQEWSRAVMLPHPPRWGDVEMEIMSRAGRPKTGFLVNAVAFATIVFAAVFYGAPLIGLAIAASHVNADVPMHPLPAFLTAGAFVAAFAISFTYWQAWKHEGRRRDAGSLIVPCAIGIVSLSAYFLLLTVPDGNGKGWGSVFALATAIGSLTLFVVILTRSRPGQRVRRLPLAIRLRTMLSPGNEMRYIEIRQEALETLIAHGRVQVDKTTLEQLERTPLGRWNRVDDPEPSS